MSSDYSERKPLLNMLSYCFKFLDICIKSENVCFHGQIIITEIQKRLLSEFLLQAWEQDVSSGFLEIEEDFSELLSQIADSLKRSKFDDNDPSEWHQISDDELENELKMNEDQIAKWKHGMDIYAEVK